MGWKLRRVWRLLAQPARWDRRIAAGAAARSACCCGVALGGGLVEARDALVATLDCTSGFYSRRRWGGCGSSAWSSEHDQRRERVADGHPRARLPIAYQVLDEGVPVYASDGEQVGTVDHVVSAPSERIFHGIVMSAGGGRRFVAADQVASLHEHGVDLRIDTAAAAALPEPHGGAAAWRDRDPGVKPSRWTHILDLMSGADPRWRDWTDED